MHVATQPPIQVIKKSFPRIIIVCYVQHFLSNFSQDLIKKPTHGFINQCIDLLVVPTYPLNLTGNPAVHAEEANVQVALNQVVTLRVYVAGYPMPGANDIQWYKDGVMIVASSSYTFASDMLSLTFEVMDKSVAGIYECRVITNQGMSSAFINVTFPGMKACVLDSFK